VIRGALFALTVDSTIFVTPRDTGAGQFMFVHGFST